MPSWSRADSTEGHAGSMTNGRRIVVAACAGVALAAVSAFALRRCARPVLTDSGLAFIEHMESSDGRTVRALRVGGVYQSATYVDEGRFEPVFAYYRAFDRIFDVGRPVRDVLAIGGGGCSWPKHVVTSRAGVRVDVVEVDAGIARAARRHFFVEEAQARALAGSRLDLYVADGRALLDEGIPCAYDAIVNDAFSGRSPVLRLASIEAVRAVKRRLRPCGVYAVNVSSSLGGSDVGFLRDTAATLAEAFDNVSVYDCTDEDFGGEDNYLVLASDAPLPEDGSIAFGREFLGSVIRDS